jgi:hypothetical protein
MEPDGGCHEAEGKARDTGHECCEEGCGDEQGEIEGHRAGIVPCRI